MSFLRLDEVENVPLDAPVTIPSFPDRIRLAILSVV